jgi:hypothetical protein
VGRLNDGKYTRKEYEIVKRNVYGRAQKYREEFVLR